MQNLMPKEIGKTRKIEVAQTVKNGAERGTVVKNQGSRSSATELKIYQQT